MIDEQQILALQIADAGPHTDYQLAIALGLPVTELPPNHILPLLHGGQLHGPCYCIRTGMVAYHNTDTGRDTEYVDPIPPFSTDLNALTTAADTLAGRTRQRGAVLLLTLQQSMQPHDVAWRASIVRLHTGNATTLAMVVGRQPSLAGTRALLVALAQYSSWLRIWHLPPLCEAP